MAKAIRSVIARFTADISAWEHNIHTLNSQLNSVNMGFGNLGASCTAIAIGFASVAVAGKLVAGTVSKIADAMVEAAKTGIEFDSQVEQATISFEVLSGSAAVAKDIISNLYDYAAKTPFEFPDIVEAGRALEVVSLSAKKNIAWIGDLAAANPQATIQEVARAIARLRSGDFGESFERLRDFGISKDMLLGQGLKFDKSGSYKGSVDQALTAVENIVKQKYAGMAAAQSKSFKGQLSTLKDNMNSAFGEIMKPAFENLTNNLLPKVIQGLENIRNSRFFEWFTNGVQWTVNAFNSVLMPAIDSVGRVASDTIRYVKVNWDEFSTALTGIKGALSPLVFIFESSAAQFIASINAMIAGVGSFMVALGDMANAATAAGSVVSKSLKGDIKGAAGDLGTALGLADKAIKAPMNVLTNTVTAYNDGLLSVHKGFEAIKNISWGDPYAGYIKPTWVPEIKAANTYTKSLKNVESGYDKLGDKIKSFISSLKSQTDAFKNFVGIFDKATSDSPISMDRWLNRLKGQVRALTQYQASIKTLETKANAGVISQGLLSDLRALGPSAAKQLGVLAAANNAKLAEANRLYGQKAGIAGNMAYDVVRGNMATEAKMIQIVNNFNGGAKDDEVVSVSKKIADQVIKQLKAQGVY